MKKFSYVSCFILLFSALIFAQTVYITKTGKKYHRASCSYLKQSSIAISLQEAVARGYTPCSRCKPPVLKGKISKASTNDEARVEKKTIEGTNSGERTGCICRDGTRSYATGRGACSHHGGVDHWLYK